MKISYTGKTDALNQAQQKKIDDKFAKMAKLLDMRQGEREAHVILSTERHLQRAEITVRYHDHVVVCMGASPDLFAAIQDAQEKLEKQILKQREKWRDTKRVAAEEGGEEETEAGTAVAVEPAPEPQIFRVDHHERRKPMTLDEALLELQSTGHNFVVYRDAESDRVSVLVRRSDGNFALIEG